MMEVEQGSADSHFNYNQLDGRFKQLQGKKRSEVAERKEGVCAAQISSQSVSRSL